MGGMCSLTEQCVSYMSHFASKPKLCDVFAGSFVVNLGDMTARWTNDLYKSTQHRVFNSSCSKPRYSVPFFCNCDFDAEVAPADIAGGAIQYPPVQAGKYIMQKLGIMWDQEPEIVKDAAAETA